jgi:MFS family permease
MPKQISSRSALILIVIAQFLGTSLWFAGNAAASEWESILQVNGITPTLTMIVQLGFIVGTLIYAIASFADRYSPSQVFLISSILAALINLAIVFLPFGFTMLLVCRFLVGFFLAGIYPVGMKIAADYFEKGLGSALGFLVGALVLGTAFPFLLKGLEIGVSWQMILTATSILALIGGLIVWLAVPDGPFRKKSPKLDFGLIPRFAKNAKLKGAAGGYFGHMWELYTFWAFLPALILTLRNPIQTISYQSIWIFTIIAAGGISCAVGGIIAQKIGSEKVAIWSLVGSGLCGLILLISPEIPPILILPFLMIWGILVTADSPQFSTLVAQSVPAEERGTALTLVNSLGFGLTVISIYLTRSLTLFLEPKMALGLLFIGPVIGVAIFKYFRK